MALQLPNAWSDPKSTGGKAMHVPIAVGAVAVFHNAALSRRLYSSTSRRACSLVATGAIINWNQTSFKTKAHEEQRQLCRPWCPPVQWIKLGTTGLTYYLRVPRVLDGWPRSSSDGVSSTPYGLHIRTYMYLPTSIYTHIGMVFINHIRICYTNALYVRSKQVSYIYKYTYTSTHLYIHMVMQQIHKPHTYTRSEAGTSLDVMHICSI
jgi:hypothetical protein